MQGIVGTKGQIVIAKEIRDRLGVEPGWLAMQRVVDDHVEIRFLPPEHNRSLKGTLAEFTRVTVPVEEWAEKRERAWKQAARSKMRGAKKKR